MPTKTPADIHYNQTELLKSGGYPITDIFTLHNIIANRAAHEISFKPSSWLFAIEECTKEETDKVSGVTSCVQYGLSKDYEQPDPDVGVRIYGGFERSIGNRNLWTNNNNAKTTIDYTVNFTNVEENSTSNQKPTSNSYTMFDYTYVDGKKLSLRLGNLQLNMQANQAALPETLLNGTTFTGINGYSGDVDKIEFVFLTVIRLVIKRYGVRFYRYAALALKVHTVKYLVFHIPRGYRTRKL